MGEYGWAGLGKKLRSAVPDALLTRPPPPSSLGVGFTNLQTDVSLALPVVPIGTIVAMIAADNAAFRYTKLGHQCTRS